jgi:hypothetical protein
VLRCIIAGVGLLLLLQRAEIDACLPVDCAQRSGESARLLKRDVSSKIMAHQPAPK